MSTSGMPEATAVAPDERVRRFVARAYGIRTLGLALGALMVGVVLYRNGAPVSVWGLMVAHGFLWPHAARLLSGRSIEPARTERNNLMVDAAMGGVWVALMQFNLLPSFALIAMFGMNLIAVGGPPLLVRGAALQAAGCIVAAVAGGLAFAPHTSLAEMLATLPLLTVLPLTLSVIMHRLARRVQRQNHLLVQLSSIDGLSGLLNRRHWEEAIAAALACHRQHGRQATMLLIDIDHFKHINDQYGHTVGDEVVRRVGTMIRTSLRDGDLAGRYGGDEFGVVLADTDPHTAEMVAERIRSGVACTLFDRAPGLRCTLSIGIARSDTGTGDVREWIRRADAALYRAKLAGRNCFSGAV